MKYLWNKVIHFFIFGSLYLNIEIIVRAYNKSLVGWNGIIKYSFAGWTSLWMFPIAGFLACIIGNLNNNKKIINLKLYQQVIISGIIVTICEFILGIILNIICKFNIWNYSNDKFNILGQICLQNTIYWFLLSIFVIWLDDVITYHIYDINKPDSLFIYIKKLITLK